MQTKSDTLKAGYQMRFSGNRTYREAVWKILCSRYFRRFVPFDAQVLDLGCGWGEFINNIGAAHKHAMDLNPDAAAHLNKDVHFIRQDCSQPWQMDSASLDIVFTSNFLEHLPDKAHVEATVAEAFRSLKFNGRIICLGPNLRYLHGAYWDFWDHCTPITDISLSEVLRLNGFTIEARLPRFLPYSMSTGRAPSPILVTWYLRLSLIWPLFGKQFLVIGRKSGGVGRGVSSEDESDAPHPPR